MGLFDDVFKGNVVTGLAIGIGAAVLGPAVLPVIASVAKPVAKAAIKGGIILYEKGKEAFAEMGEVVEDLVAEAKSEVEEAHKAAAAAAAPQGETEG
ncbi:MAG TPA: DUF5132 domain-containing protein [Thermodesulfovibrionales bacterium]|nr:DUF5132 domain-containing protein [Thermodesulfovibrionales bacterium]